MNVFSYLNTLLQKTMLQTVTIIKILCNSKRLAIVSLLSGDKKEYCVTEISEKLGISQSLTSHQLSYLEARNIVSCQRKGQTMCYSLQKNALTKKVLSVIKIIN